MHSGGWGGGVHFSLFLVGTFSSSQKVPKNIICCKHIFHRTIFLPDVVIRELSTIRTREGGGEGHVEIDGGLKYYAEVGGGRFIEGVAKRNLFGTLYLKYACQYYGITS